MPQEELSHAFKVYYEEMDRCINSRCYWSLLHVVLALPDVCSALETDDPRTKSGERYMNWCGKYLANPAISKEEWYEMRCGILHQGHTLSGKARYVKYVFGQQAPDGTKDHNRVDADKKLHLDVGALASDVKAAMVRWWSDVSASDARKRQVEERRKMLVWEQAGPTGVRILRTDQASATINPAIPGTIINNNKTSSP